MNFSPLAGSVNLFQSELSTSSLVTDLEVITFPLASVRLINTLFTFLMSDVIISVGEEALELVALLIPLNDTDREFISFCETEISSLSLQENRIRPVIPANNNCLIFISSKK